jgi:hypothetical protein
MILLKPGDIMFIIDHLDGTSSVGYSDKRTELMPTVEAIGLAKFVAKDSQLMDSFLSQKEQGLKAGKEWQNVFKN